MKDAFEERYDKNSKGKSAKNLRVRIWVTLLFLK